MASLEEITLNNLFDNPTPRVPVSLCLDCSGSIRGEPIAELNAGVETFYREIYADEMARCSAEVSIVTFGPAKLETGFQTLTENARPPSPRGDAAPVHQLPERHGAHENG